MIINTISKLVIAVVLTLAVTFGSGVVGHEIGLPIVQAAHACNGAGGGGGC